MLPYGMLRDRWGTLAMTLTRVALAIGILPTGWRPFNPLIHSFVLYYPEKYEQQEDGCPAARRRRWGQRRWLGLTVLKIIIVLIFALLLIALVAPAPIRAIPLTGGEAPQEPVCSGPYTLAPGETLAMVAVRCNLSVSQIAAANPVITDFKNAPAGTQITLPGRGEFPGGGIEVQAAAVPVTGGESAAAQSLASPANSNSGVQRYVVASGDTLSGIASRFGTTTAALSAANPSISDPDLIYPGQELLIPNQGN